MAFTPFPFIKPLNGWTTPKIMADKQAIIKSNLYTHKSFIIVQKPIDTSSGDFDISLSLLSKWTSSSVFDLFIVVFFLIYSSSFLFWTSNSSFINWGRIISA